MARLTKVKLDKLIDVLNLKKTGKFYNTNWGKKTKEGIRNIIKNILK